MAGLAGPVYRQLAEWSGTAVPTPSSWRWMPVPDTGISRLPQATEYRDHKRPAEGGDRAFFYGGHCHRDWHLVALCRKTSASSLSTGT